MAFKVSYLYKLWCIGVVALQFIASIEGFISTVSSRSHAAPISSNANLSCTVTNVTRFIGWRDPDGRNLTTDSSGRIYVQSTGSRHDLIIKNVKKSDNGIYRCVTSSASLPVTLHVEYGPSILLSQSTTATKWSSYTSSDPVELRCKSDGYPVPSIELSKDGKTIETAVGLMKYSFNTQTINDFGFYACSARNDHGAVTHYMEVAKLGPPEPPANITVDLDCDFVRVNWIPPLNSRGRPVTSYRVELLRGGRVFESEDLGPGERSYVFLQLEKYTNYEVRVNCENSEGKGLWEKRYFKTLGLCDGGFDGAALTNTSCLFLLVVSLVIAIATPN